MSFDVYLQAFGGEQTDHSSRVLTVIDGLLDDGRMAIVTSDGSADVYGLDERPVVGLMFNHIVGLRAWDVIVEVARAAGFAILPVGAPTCIVDPDQERALPDDLAAEGVVLVSSGTELLRVIEGS